MLKTCTATRTPPKASNRTPSGAGFGAGGQPAGFHGAELREISVSGGLLTGPIQPPVGTDIVMELAPPGSEAPFDLSGRVVYHAGPNQTGVKFLYREGGGSRRLRELVRRFKTL